MTRVLSRFARDERGATAIEYGLIAALVFLALFAGASGLGSVASDGWADVSDKASGAMSGGE